MSYEWAHYGSVRLKPNTALQQVLNLYPCEEAEEPHLPLHAMGEVSLEGGDVWIRVDGDLLEYRCGGIGGSLDDQVCVFLRSVADELAAEGWIDYEVDEEEIAYGPSPLACALARVESARRGLEFAQATLLRTEEELRRHTVAA